MLASEKQTFFLLLFFPGNNRIWHCSQHSSQSCASRCQATFPSASAALPRYQSSRKQPIARSISLSVVFWTSDGFLSTVIKASRVFCCVSCSWKRYRKKGVFNYYWNYIKSSYVLDKSWLAIS